MKIGMATSFRNNYGAILQAYALQQMIKKIGHSAEIIDFEPYPGRDSSLFISWRSSKSTVINIFTLLRYHSFLKRKKRIMAFHENYLKISRNKYFAKDEIKNKQSEYDAFICGSDQIWHPTSNGDHADFYYLVFTDPEKKKIAYAPSFGVSEITDAKRREIMPWLTKFSHLSVREETGQTIISQAIGKAPPVVLDPTLLMESDAWNDIKSPTVCEDDYILVYSTSQRGLFAQLVRHVKNTTGLPVVVISVNSLNLIPADRVIYDAGPREFVSLFDNAACVCTNSFHGTAFSIIYRKPFWGVPHNATNSRMYDLLNRIKLRDRQIDTSEAFPKFPLEINYNHSSELLNEARVQSLAYLHQALQA